MRHPISRTNQSLLGLALSLFIPSTMVFHKYLGIAGVGAYIAVASLALFVGHRYLFKTFVSRVTEKGVLWLALATFLVLSSTFLLVYPVANSGFYGPGNDTDDALNIGVQQLLAGHYPYSVETYRDTPIGTLPGALLLASPFVLLGTSAYQNLFWLFAFFLAMRSYLKDGRLVLLLLWGVIALSPLVLLDLVTGDDKLANSIYILLFVMWMVSTVSQPGHSSWRKLSSAILLGIGLSSRANFLLLLPLILSALFQSAGWRSATKYIAVTLATFCAVTVPFYLYDPQEFGPSIQAQHLHQLQPVIPSTDIIIPLGIVVLTLPTGVIALALSFQNMGRNVPVLFRNCAIVQAFPILCTIVLYSLLIVQRLDLMHAEYGEFFLFFGAAAFWAMLFGVQDDLIEDRRSHVTNRR